jgi:ComF family protein
LSTLEGSVLGRFASAACSSVFPDTCRLCENPLREVSRFPVCRNCFKSVEPLAADYFCSRCRAPFRNSFPLDSDGVCALCRLGLTGFDSAFAYGYYEGSLRKLIHVFKYERVYTLAKPLGALLASAFPRHLAFDSIVPVPMHWLRRWQRGFNQSELLAKELSRHTGLPVSNLLRRRRSNRVQAGLTAAERRRNVTAAFQADHIDRIRNRRLLIVDDVFTTGATAGACAAVLKRAGASQVTIATLARADRRTPPSAIDSPLLMGVA